MLVDSQSCSNIAIVLVLFVERVRVRLDLSFVAKLAKTQDFFLYTSQTARCPAVLLRGRKAVSHTGRT